MPMLEGSVVINSSTGAIITKTGAVGEAFDEMDGSTNYGALAVSNPPAYAAAREQIAAVCRAMAKFVPHTTTNAVVSTTVAASIPVATTGTAAAQTGATTAPGSGTGTVA